MNADGPADPGKVWQVFICYRRVDGSATAHWLYNHLQDRKLPAGLSTAVAAPSLDVYFDQASPAVGNWHEIHRPALERSRALIVICTPGIMVRHGDNDFVHDEIDWWMENRRTAPILIDAVSEGDRWVPEKIKEKWPNAQRIVIDLDDWELLRETDRTPQEQLAIERILGGISASEAQTRSEDAERQHALNRRLRRALTVASATLLLAVVGLGASWWFAQQAQLRQAELNYQIAISLMEQAEHAWSENDEISSRALAARAIAYNNSDELLHRYHMLHDWMEGRLESAQDHVRETLAYEYEQIVDIGLVPQLAERLAQSRSIRRSLDNLLALGARLGLAQYDAVLRFKGLTSRVEASVRKAMLEGPSNADALATLQMAQARMAHLAYHTPRAPVEKAGWDRQYFAAAKDLANAYQEVTPRALEYSGELQWRALQDQLEENEAIVDYLLYRGRYAVWILKNSGDPVRYELGEAEVIEADAAAFQNIILRNKDVWACVRKSDPPAATRGLKAVPFDKDQGRVETNEVSDDEITSSNTAECTASIAAMRFRQKIWAPVDAELGPDIDTVYIVPDGIIATVPLVALPGREPKTHLIDEKLLVYVTHALDLVEKELGISTSSGVMLVGAVEYGAAARKINHASLQAELPPLPGTGDEIEGIKQSLRQLEDVPPPIAFTDTTATEEMFRGRAPGNQVIHIAAHAWTDNPFARGYLDHGLAELPENVEAYIATLNPLLRAGIALSPVRPERTTGPTDGVLSALEVSAFDLRGTDLVVLSACDTFGTRRGGQTAIGLFRAFREAGARSIIASLYPIPDRETAILMIRFYIELYETKSAAEALRNAAMTLKDDGFSPFFWAGFVAYAPARLTLSQGPELKDMDDVAR